MYFSATDDHNECKIADKICLYTKLKLNILYVKPITSAPASPIWFFSLSVKIEFRTTELVDIRWMSNVQYIYLSPSLGLQN